MPGLGNKPAGRANHAHGAGTSSEFTQVCTHVCVAQDAPPQGGGKHVIHSLPSVNAWPSQLRRRTALTPTEPASIFGSLPPEARRQHPSVGGGGGLALGLLSVLAFGVLLWTPRALEDRAFHPRQLQASLSCPAHDLPHKPHARRSVCPDTPLPRADSPIPGCCESCLCVFICLDFWIFQRTVFMFLILSCLLYSLRIFIKHSVVRPLGFSLPWRASCLRCPCGLQGSLPHLRGRPAHRFRNDAAFLLKW